MTPELDPECSEVLRREANALYGLLGFAGAQRYPDAIVGELRQLLLRRTARLDHAASARCAELA